MIIDEKVTLRINSKNYKYYFNIIENIKFGNKYEIKVTDLCKGSHIKIKVECDICHKQKELSYREYLESYNKYNLYCCSQKCAMVKNKKTCLERYGDENYHNMDKIKQTNIEKYGKSSYLQSKDYKIKNEVSCLNKYGVKSPNSSDVVKNNKKKNFIRKYGVENPSQLNEIKKKKNKTTFNNYGVENPAQSLIIQTKMKQSRIVNGNQIPDEDLSEFRIYSKSVINETNLNKKKLFDDWNGYDYYDDKYIKENFILNCNHPNYPTIDHKNSIYYGFVNNINSKEISKLENLCITKRTINSTKNKKCFYERKKED